MRFRILLLAGLTMLIAWVGAAHAETIAATPGKPTVIPIRDKVGFYTVPESGFCRYEGATCWDFHRAYLDAGAALKVLWKGNGNPLRQDCTIGACNGTWNPGTVIKKTYEGSLPSDWYYCGRDLNNINQNMGYSRHAVQMEQITCPAGYRLDGKYASGGGCTNCSFGCAPVTGGASNITSTFLVGSSIAVSAPPASAPAKHTYWCNKVASVYSCPTGQNWTLSGSQCTRPDTKGNGPVCPSTRLPIALGTGNKWLSEVDSGTRGGLHFVRTYNSNPGTVASVFGARWRASYSQFIGLGHPEAIWLYRPDGKSIKFLVSGNEFVPEADVSDRLYGETDAGGKLLGYRLVTADQGIERYDTDGRLLSLTDIRGQSQILAYDSQNRLSAVSDAFGRRLSFTYDSANRVAMVTDPSSQTIAYTYDSPNNLSTVTYPDGTVRKFHYEDSAFPNALTGVTDENGVRYVTYHYDAQGRAVGEVMVGDVAGHQLTFSTDSTTVTDALGTARTYNFQTLLGVVRETGSSQPGGAGCAPASRSIAYDGNGNVSSRTSFNGDVTTYAYDLARNLETKRVEASSRPEARTHSTQWHETWRLPAKVAEPKKLTSYVYNGDTDQGVTVSCAPAEAMVPSGAGSQPIGVLCQKIEQATDDSNGSQGFAAVPVGASRTWTWTYDAFGQVLSEDGPLPGTVDVTTTTYYPADDPDLGKRGHVATITNALGHVTQITAYDANGRPLAFTDPNGVVTTLTYDLRGRLTAKSLVDETTGYRYDGVGNLLEVSFPDGRRLSYTYDGAHRLTEVADGQGNRITYTLDAAGNRIKDAVTDPQGSLVRLRSRAFDLLGRLAEESGAAGQVTSYAYDANGNLTGLTDPLDRSSFRRYDALNRLVGLTDPAGGVTGYAYDGRDQLAAVTDPRGLVTRYTVDGLGQQTAQESPDTGTTRRSYDEAGRLVEATDAKGQTTTYAYDALHRVTAIRYADGSGQRYTYDTGAHALGRLTQVEEVAADGAVSGSQQLAYDALGRVVTDTRLVGPVILTTGYQYSSGRLTALTYPSGRQLAYQYDAAGRVSQIALTDEEGVTVLADAITYQPFGGLAGFTNGAGQLATRHHDQDGQLTAYTLGHQTWNLSYDAAGRLERQEDLAVPGQAGLYRYDALDRLVGAVLPSTSYDYSYDATGNRTGTSAGSASSSYRIAADSNRLLALSGSETRSYQYDANGSLTSDGALRFAYDVRGRLASVTSGQGTTAYTVNAVGQRVQKSGPGGTTLYHYDGAGHLLAEASAEGRILREYVWLGDLPLAVLH